MRITCDYCGASFDTSEGSCPKCGGSFGNDPEMRGPCRQLQGRPVPSGTDTDEGAAAAEI